MELNFKATFLSVTFLAVGALAWWWIVPRSATAVPHFLFYLTLVVNTYFSIKALSSICGIAPYQRAFDVALGVVYILLATSMGRPTIFEAVTACLFGLATTKYLFLATFVHLGVVKRKIVIDALGLALCSTALVASLCGYSQQSAWLLASVFLLANAYLLMVRPMYQFNEIGLTHVDMTPGERSPK
jgi:hypothetical protein